MRDNVSILWIDDDQSFLNSTGRIFQNEGFKFNGVAKGKEGVGEIRKNKLKYDLIMTDLDMPHMDGIDVLREIRKINKKIPIGFASAHFGEPKWDKRLRALGIDVLRIEKPFPVVTSNDFTEIKNEMLKLVKSIKGNWKNNPFLLSLTEFKDLTDDDINQLFEMASMLNSEYIEEYFLNNPDKDWAVIAKEPGNVIASGNAENEPIQEDLEKLAKMNDVPVFTYTRSKIVEEIDCGWSTQEDPDDYYPSITIAFESKKDFKFDFDTGSQKSFLSYEELMNKKVVDRLMWLSHSSIMWGGEYSYFNIKLKSKLLGKMQSKDIDLRCEAVKDWKNSPLAANYKNRVGLIGRHLLTDNNIKLVLDGENKETDIL